MYESWVFAFVLPLAMLFSLLMLLVKLFHACETLAKQASVLIHAAFGKFRSCCFEGNTSG